VFGKGRQAEKKVYSLIIHNKRIEKKMKNIITLTLVIGIIFLLASCSKDTGTGPDQLTDEQFIQQQITTSDSLADILLSEEATINDESELEWDVGKITTPIKPFRWGRTIETVNRNVTVVIIGDSVAIATIVKTISGQFIIRASYSDEALFPDTTIRKPFTERTERRLRFVRIARSEHRERNWRPVAITLVQGDAQPDSNNKFFITSLEITTTSDTYRVSNPLDTWLRFGGLRTRVPLWTENDSVNVRLTIESTDTARESSLLRFGVMRPEHPRHRLRMQLVSEVTLDSTTYFRVYERKFPVRLPMGLPMGIAVGSFHAVVDVISKGTLFDDSAPVSNRFWGLPYLARRQIR
jgi:hypothetical protein